MDDVERQLAASATELNGRQLAPEPKVLMDTRWRGPMRLQGLCADNLY